MNLGTLWVRFVEKTRGKKSRATVPLRAKNINQQMRTFCAVETIVWKKPWSLQGNLGSWFRKVQFRIRRIYQVNVGSPDTQSRTLRNNTAIKILYADIMDDMKICQFCFSWLNNAEVCRLFVFAVSVSNWVRTFHTLGLAQRCVAHFWVWLFDVAQNSHELQLKFFIMYFSYAVTAKLKRNLTWKILSFNNKKLKFKMRSQNFLPYIWRRWEP